MSERMKVGLTDVRKYVDVDVIQSTSNVTGGNTNLDFISVIDRKPVAALFAYQYVGDYQTVTGNPHRFFNPGILSAYVQVGNGQRVPLDAMIGTAQSNLVPYNAGAGGPPVVPATTFQPCVAGDAAEMYRAFLKTTDIVGFKNAECIDFQSFAGTSYKGQIYGGHKFLLAFDLRQLEFTNFAIPGALKLSLIATHNTIPVAAVNPGYTGAPPGGPAIVWLFLFMERNVKVIENAMGTAVIPNWIDEN